MDVSARSDASAMGAAAACIAGLLAGGCHASASIHADTEIGSSTTATSDGSSTTGTSTTTTTSTTGPAPGSSGGTTSTTGSLDGTGSGGSTGGNPIDLGPLSDDFGSGDLTGWMQFQPALAQVRVQSGQLLFDPAAQTLWYNGSSASLLYKQIPGNFMVTSMVTARSLSNPSQPPQPTYRLGGLMARSANDSNGENYVFIVVGADGDNLSVETKTTVDGQSQYMGPAWPNGSGELRICKVGSTVEVLIREPGNPWTVQDTYDRPDLPHTLQVGPTAYANNPVADLQVAFDSVDFANVGSLADCTK